MRLKGCDLRRTQSGCDVKYSASSHIVALLPVRLCHSFKFALIIVLYTVQDHCVDLTLPLNIRVAFLNITTVPFVIVIVVDQLHPYSTFFRMISSIAILLPSFNSAFRPPFGARTPVSSLTLPVLQLQAPSPMAVRCWLVYLPLSQIFHRQSMAPDPSTFPSTDSTMATSNSSVPAN